MFKPQILCAALIAATVTACDKPAPPAPQVRPVRAVTVERLAEGEAVSLTGHVRAKDQVGLAFRLDGRMIERLVNVGDVVTAGQVVAKLDPMIQQNGLNAAQANLASLEATLTNARITFWRQQQLIKNGWTSQAKFDEAKQKLETTQSQVEASQATLSTAQEQLSYTVLTADGPGAITKVGAQPGEVVQAGKMIVQVARQGPRDAVFDVPEQLIKTGPRDGWSRSLSPTTRPCGLLVASGRWRPRRIPPPGRGRSRSASSTRPRPCAWEPLLLARPRWRRPPACSFRQVR
jgi:multidrug efflux pump subunit AcrA (membrane-fusion protein)